MTDTNDIEDDVAPTIVTQTGTCHTPECGNEGAPITLNVPEGTPWICGVCGQPIEDVIT